MAAEDSSGNTQDAMKNLWTLTVERVKKVAQSPILYRALERTIPIAWEDSSFVVGFTGADGQMASTMNTGDNLGTIERALRAVSSDPNLRLRVIHGSTYDDWEQAKQRDAAAISNRVQSAQKKAVETGTLSSWDQVYEQISRLWAGMEYRSLPSGKARFYDKAFELVVKAMAEGLYPSDGAALDETTERGLGRVMERIASMTAADPALVGYLLMERWKVRDHSHASM